MSERKPRNKVRLMHGADVYGYTKKDIKKIEKNGQVRYVWKSKHKNGKKNMWAKSVKKAYTELRKKGVIDKGEFVPLNKGKKGKMLYETTMNYYTKKILHYNKCQNL